MTFRLSIECDNAAFGDAGGDHDESTASPEVTRILKDVVDKVAVGETFGRMRDINGNYVGAWRLG